MEIGRRSRDVHEAGILSRDGVGALGEAEDVVGRVFVVEVVVGGDRAGVHVDGGVLLQEERTAPAVRIGDDGVGHGKAIARRIDGAAILLRGVGVEGVVEQHEVAACGVDPASALPRSVVGDEGIDHGELAAGAVKARAERRRALVDAGGVQRDVGPGVVEVAAGILTGGTATPPERRTISQIERLH